MGAEATLVMMTTGRSLKKRKHQELLSGSSSVCSQNVQRRVSGGAWSHHVWHEELVALVFQVFTSMEGRAKQGNPDRWRA